MTVGIRNSGCFRYLVGCLVGIVSFLAIGYLCIRLYFVYSCGVVVAPYRSLVRERADEKEAIVSLGKPWHIITSKEGADPAGEFKPYEETGIRVPGKVLVYPETVCCDYAIVYVFINRAGKVFDVKLIIMP